MPRKVSVIALQDSDGNRDGEAGFVVEVDGHEVCEIDADETDIADVALSPMWKALDIKLIFDYD